MQDSRCTCSSSVPRVLQLRAQRWLTGEEVVEDGQVETATVDDGEQVQPCRRATLSLAPPLLLLSRTSADEEVVVDDGNGGGGGAPSLLQPGGKGIGELGERGPLP